VFVNIPPIKSISRGNCRNLLHSVVILIEASVGFKVAGHDLPLMNKLGFMR